jgi:hypothetical protein
MTRTDAPRDRLLGALLAAVTLLVICDEWGVGGWAGPAKPLLTVALIGVYLPRVGRGRRAFILFGAALTAALAAVEPDWVAAVRRALDIAAFIAAFFSSLTVLKTVAETSPAIQRAGRFLAGQPPGRRYLALTLGGQAFTLLLNYGSLQLLGAMAVRAAREEPDPEIRRIRMRRMLLAVERGLVSTLPWSPLSFAVAISTSVVAGVSWATVALPSLVTGVILAGVGWALDTLVKPAVTGPRRPRAAPEGNWLSLAPLGVLLAVLVASVSVGHAFTDVRIIGLVAVIAPCMAVGWLILQTPHAPATVAARLRAYLVTELPGFSNEMCLLMMAGYIGSVGAVLLAPALAALGIDLSAAPTWALLVGFVWVIPVLGQLAMNPIMAVTLIGPLIPSAETLGVSPVAVVVAITAGWAVSGASSPFTATQLLLAHYAGLSARHIAVFWNGAYVLISMALLSVWVVAFAYLF